MTEPRLDRPFIRGQIAIESMRDNGFLSAAHALAELIDNSIQAGANHIELLAFEQRSEAKEGGRSRRNVDKIAVFDNGAGMSKDVLHLALEFGASKNRDDKEGIGRFGMGLPNSSVSQCRRVDVWSWQEGSTIAHTYLDIDEILDGRLETIPYPVDSEIPEDIAKCLGEGLPKSGTLVLWSNLDRCQWKTGTTIYKHTQDIVGRMYRKFMQDDQVTIRFKCALLDNNLYIIDNESKFKANDPLFLMKDTALPDLPGDFKGEAFFEIVDDGKYEFGIADENGVEQKVQIVGSIVKKPILEEILKTTDGKAGSTAWGKYAYKNIGVSVVRAGRELALTDEFLTTDMKQYTGRWCGIEISFSPALDRVFGVTNNKQHVVNLKMMNMAEEALKEGFESEADYRADLRENNDPKLKIYEVIDQILNVRSQLQKRLAELSFDGKKSKLSQSGSSKSVEDIIRDINIKETEREKKHPVFDDAPVTVEEVEKTLIETGSSETEAKVVAESIVENKLKVWVEERPLSTPAFFDVTTSKGFTLLQLNSNHVFTTEILQQLPKEKREAIEICLAGWARMERETTSEKRKQQLQMARKDWGQLLEDFLDDEE
ncbi:ATP-binding protein [Endozoicomonas sp. ALE010]|uniref:ATP-binding protein n=1 Tax=Endozoicomonas sp. ALE010 TaxID=3403081 RepID=UPI003BB4E24C